MEYVFHPDAPKINLDQLDSIEYVTYCEKYGFRKEGFVDHEIVKKLRREGKKIKSIVIDFKEDGNFSVDYKLK